MCIGLFWTSSSSQACIYDYCLPGFVCSFLCYIATYAQLHFPIHLVYLRHLSASIMHTAQPVTDHVLNIHDVLWIFIICFVELIVCDRMVSSIFILRCLFIELIIAQIICFLNGCRNLWIFPTPRHAIFCFWILWSRVDCQLSELTSSFSAFVSYFRHILYFASNLKSEELAIVKTVGPLILLFTAFVFLI